MKNNEKKLKKEMKMVDQCDRTYQLVPERSAIYILCVTQMFYGRLE